LWRPALHSMLGTNAACRRLAPLPASLVQVTAGSPSYDELRAAAAAGGITKFFDVNLTALFAENPVRDTLEVRILPGSIVTGDVMRGAALVEALLERCLDEMPIPAPPTDSEAAVRELRVMAGEAALRRRPGPTRLGGGAGAAPGQRAERAPGCTA
jgi:hypothetical protein